MRLALLLKSLHGVLYEVSVTTTVVDLYELSLAELTKTVHFYFSYILSSLLMEF